MSDYIEPDTPGPAHGAGTPSGRMSSVDFSAPFDDPAPGLGGGDNVEEDNDTSGGSSSCGTLDESVLATLRRDVDGINATLRKVVYPHFPSRQLLSSADSAEAAANPLSSTGDGTIEDISANCDLWAPLLFVIAYSLCVSHARSLFSSLFVLCWALLLCMSLHLRLTKPRENVNLITYVSLAGYCMFPQVINAALTQVVYPVLLHLGGAHRHWTVRILTLLDIATLACCMVWSLTAISLVTNARGFIQIFPLGLCLLGLSWLATIL